MDGKEWFFLFWTSKEWQTVVENTNKYAKKQRTLNPDTGYTPRPLYGSWRPITVTELKAFIAIVIVLGVYRIRSYRDLWRQPRRRYRLGNRSDQERRAVQLGRGNGKFTTCQWIPHRSIFTRALSQTRFTKIKRYLHIADPDIVLTDAEWYKKLEPISSSIRQRCQTLAIPATNVSVDEMMVRFFGRSKHTVRMPKKPIKEGFKIFASCERGYTYNWLFCSRKTGIAELPPHATLAPTQAAVRYLALSLPYNDYHFNVYMDNLFTTVPLLLDLRKNSIGGMGTTRTNAFPAHLRKLTSGSTWNTVSKSATAEGKVLGLEWQDQKTVQILTTLHPVGGTIKRRRKQPRNTSTNGAEI